MKTSITLTVKIKIVSNSGCPDLYLGQIYLTWKFVENLSSMVTDEGRRWDVRMVVKKAVDDLELFEFWGKLSQKKKRARTCEELSRKDKFPADEKDPSVMFRRLDGAMINYCFLVVINDENLAPTINWWSFFINSSRFHLSFFYTCGIIILII